MNVKQKIHSKTLNRDKMHMETEITTYGNIYAFVSATWQTKKLQGNTRIELYENAPVQTYVCIRKSFIETNICMKML